MAKHVVEVTPEHPVEVDVGPGMPALTGLQLDFTVTTEDERCAARLEALGFDVAEMLVTKVFHHRFAVPLTRDGELVGHATVSLRLSGELASLPVQPAIPAMGRLVQAARDARGQERAHA